MAPEVAMKHRHVIAFTMAVVAGASLWAQPAARPRARDLGLAPGVFDTGALNAITDVSGVAVGHVTLHEGDAVRTGVTVVVPHPGNVFQDKVAGAVFVGNAFGKLAGSTQVDELGTIETPVVLTNTLSVGAAVEGVAQWTLAQEGNADVRSVNALVGETNDAGLNDIRGLHVRPDHVVNAIRAARSGAVPEGSVGAGTGTQAFGWKGGIGTSSRLLPASLGGYTVGALVQSNYGGILTIDGVPVGERLGRFTFRDQLDKFDQPDAGSCMIVLATDAPLSARNLERLARRAVLGLARTGSYLDNGSGDFVIAFSTRGLVPHQPPARTLAGEELVNDAMSPLFLAAVEAVEEAVYNSLLRATSVTGDQGHVGEAIPVERVRELMGKDRGR
jgi:D-aminopeptidase